MENVVLLEPIGNLTPEMSTRLCDAVLAAPSERNVIITLRSVAQCSWSGLSKLSEVFASEHSDPRRVTFRDVSPRVRCLLDTVGLGSFVEPRPLCGVSL
jgi:hypothetical protein